jgi:hypothetical protein
MLDALVVCVLFGLLVFCFILMVRGQFPRLFPPREKRFYDDNGAEIVWLYSDDMARIIGWKYIHTGEQRFF